MITVLTKVNTKWNGEIYQVNVENLVQSEQDTDNKNMNILLDALRKNEEKYKNLYFETEVFGKKWGNHEEKRKALMACHCFFSLIGHNKAFLKVKENDYFNAGPDYPDGIYSDIYDYQDEFFYENFDVEEDYEEVDEEKNWKNGKYGNIPPPFTGSIDQNGRSVHILPHSLSPKSMARKYGLELKFIHKSTTNKDDPEESISTYELKIKQINKHLKMLKNDVNLRRIVSYLDQQATTKNFKRRRQYDIEIAKQDLQMLTRAEISNLLLTFFRT